MRIYDIALFVLIFNLSLSTVTNMNLVNTTYASINFGGDTAAAWTAIGAANAGNISTSATSGAVNSQATFSWFNAFWNGAILVIPTVANILFQSTIGVPFMLQELGFPNELVALLSVLVYFIYTIGVFQMWLNKNLERSY